MVIGKKIIILKDQMIYLHMIFLKNKLALKNITSESKYYNLGDPKFVWPEMDHGAFND